MLRYKTQTRN